METQTNITPAPESNSSGANTVLLVIIIILLVGGGYWWYTHRRATPRPSAPPVNIEVKVPTVNTTPSEPSSTKPQ